MNYILFVMPIYIIAIICIVLDTMNLYLPSPHTHIHKLTFLLSHDCSLCLCFLFLSLSLLSFFLILSFLYSLPLPLSVSLSDSLSFKDFITSEEEKNILQYIENDTAANWETELTRRVKVNKINSIENYYYYYYYYYFINILL